VALQQLNLKLPPEVLADWKQRAAADGLSVRDWLLATLAPAVAAPAADGLVARVEALEAAVARLAAAPRPLPPPAPAVAPLAPTVAAVPADGIETGALAEVLGLRRKTLNARIARAGGARVGLTLQGWRCCGLARPARGGPPSALWVPDQVPG
jgi:hypothetical protein